MAVDTMATATLALNPFARIPDRQARKVKQGNWASHEGLECSQSLNGQEGRTAISCERYPELGDDRALGPSQLLTIGSSEPQPYLAGLSLSNLQQSRWKGASALLHLPKALHPKHKFLPIGLAVGHEEVVIQSLWDPYAPYNPA